LLVRTSEDDYVAYSQKCTHLSCAVYYARDRNRLECPCHEGYFAVEDGRVLQGPPPRPLPRVLLERQGADLVAVGMRLGPGH
jgi:Rieske Fe-S protein